MADADKIKRGDAPARQIAARDVKPGMWIANQLGYVLGLVSRANEWGRKIEFGFDASGFGLACEPDTVFILADGPHRVSTIRTRATALAAFHATPIGQAWEAYERAELAHVGAAMADGVPEEVFRATQAEYLEAKDALLRAMGCDLPE